MQLMSDIASNCSIDIEFVISKMMNFLSKLFEEFENHCNIETIEKEISKLEHQKSFLLDKYMNGIVNDSDYKKKNNELETKIDSLNEKLEHK